MGLIYGVGDKLGNDTKSCIRNPVGGINYRGKGQRPVLLLNY